MITTLTATAILLGAASAPEIKFDDGRFIITTAPGVKLIESTDLVPTKKIEQIVFRKNDTFAVWDTRGLSIRSKNRTKTTKLVDFALSPKLFSREEILKTKDLIAKGIRHKEVSALSGAKRVANDAFFLARWDDSKGKVWLEALLKVDLDAEKPVAQLVGKFDGLSLATKPIDDRLFILNGALSVITKADGSWNLAKYDVHTKTFGAYVQGLDLESFTPIGSKLGLFVEKASNGNRIVGRVDLMSGSRHTFVETRKKVFVLDQSQPSIVVLDDALLHNLDSGVQTPKPIGSKTKRTEAGILVWWPAKNPTRATLLDPERWTVLAKWDKNAQPAPKKTTKKAELSKKSTKKGSKEPVKKADNTKKSTKKVKVTSSKTKETAEVKSPKKGKVTSSKKVSKDTSKKSKTSKTTAKPTSKVKTKPSAKTTTKKSKTND